MCCLTDNAKRKNLIEKLRRKRRDQLAREKLFASYMILILIWMLDSKQKLGLAENQSQEYWDHLTLQDMRRAQELYYIQHPRYPDMPPRYRNNIPPLNTLIDYLAVDHLRDDAFTVILKTTPVAIHEWLKDAFITEGHRLIRLCKKPRSEDTLQRLIFMSEKWQAEQAEEEVRRGQAKYEYRPDDKAFVKPDDASQGPKPSP